MSAEKRVSIAYAWDTPEYQLRVKKLAAALEANGIEVRFDQWDAEPGQSLNYFMERLMLDEQLNNVLLLLSPIYKIKADQALGGVGRETQYARDKIMRDVKQTRFIPVLFAV
ncbi:toll/interleukin-1 receptor domain-containing protein, partial [Deinococcus multiflagellatus]